MDVIIIAAVAENRAIGKDNDLIWKLPDDMAFFSRSTKGHTIITGRKNYESIPHKYRPLPGRDNIVVTRNDSYEAAGSDVVTSLQVALDIAAKKNPEKVFVIGGGQIYSEAIRQGLVTEMLITHVHEHFDADVFFPEVDYSNWRKVSSCFHPADEHHEHAFTISRYLVS